MTNDEPTVDPKIAARLLSYTESDPTDETSEEQANRAGDEDASDDGREAEHD